ncbi:MAG TPA: AMP-dependent synthetase [Clostridiales bacterium]|nr:AMP-dependent synthetase [Clostridiales bacterium]
MKKERNKLRDAKRFNNIKEVILNSVSLYGDNIAYVTKVKKDKADVQYINHTYNDLLNDIYCFGTGLYKLGLKNSRVAVCGRNSYKWVVSHLSNLMGGIVSVPIDKELQLNELEESLIRSNVEALVFDEKYKDNILKIKENGKTNIKFFICMSKLDGFICYDELLEEGKKGLENGENEFKEYTPNSKNMSILLFTSGTTSKAKAVMLSQDGICANIADLQMVEGIKPTDTNIAFLPFHHIFSSTGMLFMMACGVRTVFPDGLKYIKQNLHEYEVSVFVGVPLLINKMYETIEKEIEKQGKTKLLKNAVKISNFLLRFHIDVRKILFRQIVNALGGKMRLIVAGGAPLEKRIAQGFNDFGIHLVQGYGLTETSPVISAENDKYIKPGSVGIPMRSMKVEVVNKDQDGIGKIRVKGPNIMLGYYENEEATNAVLRDGWFYTGDLGYFDEDGFLFLTGRQKDVIVLKNGKKVFPEELEMLVDKLEEVEESFIYGMPQNGNKNDPMVSLEVVYAEDAIKDKTEEELKKIIWDKVKEINKTLPQYKYIKNLIVTNEPLIKTTTHKVKRKEELEKVLNR